MSRTRIVKGKITEITGGTSRIFGESIKINSNGRIDYFAQNYTYGEPQLPPIKFGIKEIELITTLEDGSTNDLSGGLQKGMVYENEYHFKVKSYINQPPINLNSIKWMIRYHSLSQNKWLDILLTVKGEQISITMNEKEMCGRFIYIRAFITNPERESELKIWKHNRFRYFNRTKVHEQIKNRVKDPWKIDQAQTSLCGMAALYYAMIKRDSKAYEKLAKELFRTGEYTINNYIIKPHEKALSMYDVKPTDSNYKSMRMKEIDWIVLATTRSKESLNSQFVYKGFENGDMDMLKAVNWPDLLTRMCKEVAGFSNSISHDLGLLQITNKKGMSGKLNDSIGDIDILNLKIIDRKYKEGKTILMMIDSNMIENITSYNLKDLTTNSHWVVYEGGLNFIEVGDSKFVGFKIYTWGYNPITQLDELGKSDYIYQRPLIYNHQRISIESFKSNYYGYIEVY